MGVTVNATITDIMAIMDIATTLEITPIMVTTAIMDITTTVIMDITTTAVMPNMLESECWFSVCFAAASAKSARKFMVARDATDSNHKSRLTVTTSDLTSLLSLLRDLNHRSSSPNPSRSQSNPNSNNNPNMRLLSQMSSFRLTLKSTYDLVL